MSESGDQSQAATTTLHIVFAGLCLLVRDKTGDGKDLLHALLPAGPGHAQHHQARLIFDPVYGCESPHSTGACRHRLDGVLLDLTDPETFGSGITGGIKIGGIVDEACTKGTPVRRRHIDEVPPTELVKSRITIASGREGKHKGHGAKWNHGPCKTHFMANWVHWVISDVRLTNGTLTLPILINGNAPRQPMALKPDNGEIVLLVFHSMSTDLPIEIPKLPLRPKNKLPRPGDEAVHFRAFHPLIGKSESDDPGPTYVSGAKAGGPRGLDFMCIMATAPAEPKPQP